MGGQRSSAEYRMQASPQSVTQSAYHFVSSKSGMSAILREAAAGDRDSPQKHRHSRQADTTPLLQTGPSEDAGQQSDPGSRHSYRQTAVYECGRGRSRQDHQNHADTRGFVPAQDRCNSPHPKPDVACHLVGIHQELPADDEARNQSIGEPRISSASDRAAVIQWQATQDGYIEVLAQSVALR